VHVERALWESWRASCPHPAPRDAGERGEGLRLVEFPEPVSASALLSSGFARAVMPVHYEIPRQALVSEARDAALASIAELAKAAGASRIVATAIRRHGSRAAALVRDWAQRLDAPM